MKDIEARFKSACKKYNAGGLHYADCFELSKVCIAKLLKDARIVRYGDYAGKPRVEYHVATLGGDLVSRPFRKPAFIDDLDLFQSAHDRFIKKVRESDISTPEDIELATSIIYTSVIAFAACYDLWKNRSRKTPGTLFEILMAGLFRQYLSTAVLSKHINLAALIDEPIAGTEVEEAQVEPEDGDEEDEKSSLSTDLVISVPEGKRTAIIPLKITTRERIVQPYAHQRIVDSAMPHQYESFLACMSETQLDKETRAVKQVCVPGTIKLFQRYLGKLSGIYYCDMPQRYAAADLARYVPVKLLGAIFEDVKMTIVPPI
jgi:hypothetical protein